MIQIDHFLGSVTGQGVRVEYNIRITYIVVSGSAIDLFDS